jgi:hypothetical protein
VQQAQSSHRKNPVPELRTHADVVQRHGERLSRQTLNLGCVVVASSSPRARQTTRY